MYFSIEFVMSRFSFLGYFTGGGAIYAARDLATRTSLQPPAMHYLRGGVACWAERWEGEGGTFSGGSLLGWWLVRGGLCGGGANQRSRQDWNHWSSNTIKDSEVNTFSGFRFYLNSVVVVVSFRGLWRPFGHHFDSVSLEKKFWQKIPFKWKYRKVVSREHNFFCTTSFNLATKTVHCWGEVDIMTAFLWYWEKLPTNQLIYNS